MGNAAQAAANRKPFEVQGVVKSFSRSDGYGFVKPDDVQMRDVFLHVRCLQDIGRDSINKGARIVCKAEYQKGVLRVKSIVAIK